MSYPGDIEAVMALLKERDTEVSNEELIQAAGGDDAEFGRYMIGHRANDIVGFLQSRLEKLELGILNERKGYWRVVCLSEYRMTMAEKRLQYADPRLNGAYKLIVDMCNDSRTSPEWLREAKILLDWWSQEETRDALEALRELSAELSKKARQARLVIVGS